MMVCGLMNQRARQADLESLALRVTFGASLGDRAQGQAFDQLIDGTIAARAPRSPCSSP